MARCKMSPSMSSEMLQTGGKGACNAELGQRREPVVDVNAGVVAWAHRPPHLWRPSICRARTGSMVARSALTRAASSLSCLLTY